MRPESIVLSRGEGLNVMVAVDDAAAMLEATDYLVAVLQLEEASFILRDRLYPEE